ncbi:CKLF-like MARVEL transmembrane domain-containing protein 4 [Episyrphus balteatus]|uniref:CKLF-like MARVEL transmembrane domain-containing protein 4 n=1 Tax=Episyrphus balteatus TaxID=286459 RepID=UPI002486A329|nr:CKLF-like MARVEL transmembrane domain-containing protein 4 [Episyrphus balteatus]
MTETVINVNNHQQTNSAPPTGGPFSWIIINVDYFKRLPGIVKIVQFVLGIICMIFVSPARLGATTFFLFVVIMAFIATILWAAAYFLGIREALTLPINWILTELINTGIATILYLIASIIQIAAWSKTNYHGYHFSNITGGVLGLINFLAYAAGSYFLYLELRMGSTH